MTYEVQQFLNDLSDFFFHQCPLLKFERIRVGSSIEGTKTGQADEFDVLLHFAQLSKCIMNVGDHVIQWNGMDVNVKEELAQCFTGQDNISLGVQVKFFQLIMDFVAEKKTWGSLSFRCLKQFKCG